MEETNGQSLRAENKMGVMPVNRLLLTMALPMMLSMMVQALYNIVDSIFVSRVCENALTAVSLAFPVQNIMIATGVGIAVGVNALLSKRLGEHRYEEVNQAATNGLFLAAIAYVIYLVIGLVLPGPFMRMQTDDPQIIEYGTQYMRIVCVLSFGLFASILFERFLTSTGKTVLSMVTQGVGAIVNVIMDPILIFGLFGFPRMEVVGAALATVIGQCCGAAVGIILQYKKNHEVTIRFKRFRPDGYAIKRILGVAIPSLLSQGIGSVMTFFLNRILMAFTSTAVAVFGAYFKLQSFVFMPIFGLNNGMIPIIAYNYGARNKPRVTKVIRLAITYAVCLMLVGLAVAQLFPGQLLGMFNASADMLEIGIPAIRTISLCFVFAGFCVVTLSVFQAFGNGTLSLWVSFARQLVILLPVAYLFSLSGRLSLIWWAFPIAELMSVALAVIFLVLVYNKYIRHLGEPEAA